MAGLPLQALCSPKQWACAALVPLDFAIRFSVGLCSAGLYFVAPGRFVTEPGFARVFARVVVVEQSVKQDFASGRPVFV